MDDSVKEWIKEAEDNMVTARILNQNERYKDSAYYCHQVVEKTLKAVQIKELRRFDMVHDLVKLAKSVNAPKDIVVDCEKLTKYYIPARYPVSKRIVLGEKDSENGIKIAEEVIEWAMSILK